MAIAITVPVVALGLFGIGFMMWRRQRTKRRRNSMPYDEEFESLKNQHEARFGLGHNY